MRSCVCEKKRGRRVERRERKSDHNGCASGAKRALVAAAVLSLFSISFAVRACVRARIFLRFYPVRTHACAFARPRVPTICACICTCMRVCVLSSRDGFHTRPTTEREREREREREKPRAGERDGDRLCCAVVAAAVAVAATTAAATATAGAAPRLSFVRAGVVYKMKWSPQTLFCEQVGELTRVFSQWNECEQTVVLYALLRRIPAVQARFLAQAVQHSLHSVTELDSQERNANNPAYISALLSETTEVAINQLLAHLPLLRPGNVECKQSYLMVIPELISHCVSTGQYTEQTQQLLSYTLIHPAITSQDRRSLSHWLGQLEDRIINTPVQSNVEDYTNNIPLRWDVTWQKSIKQNDQIGQAYGTQNGTPFNFQFQLPITRQRRSNSLTPPVASCLQPDVISDRSGNSNMTTRHKARSFSVSGDHSSALIGMGPLSPPSSCASSGSEGRLDEASARPLSSGMRDVPAWLKTLRLHKYSYLFTNLSYEEMLELTEDRLAEQGVTKGARHKLALSIVKLQQRYQTLLDLEKDLVQPQRETTSQSASFAQKPLLVSALDELKTILATPLKPSQENDVQDIPNQFTKVLGKLCNRLALESNIDDAVLCSCINIFEKVLQHDCFTPSQKEKVQQWRSRLGNPRPTSKWQHNHAYFNRKYNNSQQHNRKPSLNLSHMSNVKSGNFMITGHRNSISTPYLQSSSNQSSNQSNLQPVQAPEKRPSLQETSLELLQKTLQRTYSAPRDNFPGYSSNAIETTEPEINSCLESLCLRMTEQAIGGFGEA